MKSTRACFFYDALYNPPQQTNYPLFGFNLFDEKKEYHKYKFYFCEKFYGTWAVVLDKQRFSVLIP